MTPIEFQRYGIRMYGRKHWRREYAINLGLDFSTVWRMSKRTKDIPLVVEVAIRGLLEKHKIIAKHAVEQRMARAREKHRYQGKITAGLRKKPKPTAQEQTDDPSMADRVPHDDT